MAGLPASHCSQYIDDPLGPAPGIRRSGADSFSDADGGNRGGAGSRCFGKPAFSYAVRLQAAV